MSNKPSISFPDYLIAEWGERARQIMEQMLETAQHEGGSKFVWVRDYNARIYVLTEKEA